MPLPDERPRQSVANLIGRFEQQTKKQPPSSPGPRSLSVVSHTTGDSTKEEIKDRREWPPRTSNAASPPNDSKVGGRDWPPRLSTQSSGDSSGQRWPPVQPPIQTTPFSESKKSSPLAESSGLNTPPEVDKAPSPPPEPPKVIEVTPPSRKPTLMEPEPPKSVEPEPVEIPRISQPTVTPSTTKPGPLSVATKSPPSTAKIKPAKLDTKTPDKLPPSSFTKGTPLHPDSNDRRTSTSARPSSRPTSRVGLRSKTPISSPPVRPQSSAQRKPPTEIPRNTSTPVRRSKTPVIPRQSLATPSKPPPVIPKTPNSRLYAPTAASLAKSTNSPQPPPPERKKTLSSGASLERLSKPTASSLSKSKSAHPTASPPKSKLTPTKAGTLTTSKKTVTTSKPGNKTEASGSIAAKNSVIDQERHENGNGLGAIEETLHPETELLGVENHECESDPEDEHLGNGSLEASHTEESLETTDSAVVRDHEVLYSPADQGQAETPEDVLRSRSPEPVDPASDLHTEEDATHEPLHEVSVKDEESKQEGVKDDIAVIVGLLESTSFTSKHILQGPDEAATNDLLTPISDKDRLRIGEIPDEE